MPYSIASATEIDKKLRDDFRRRLKDYGIVTEFTDPILSVLFRTFAHQLELLYSDTDRIRLSLLDELINNLGMEPRMARPAQTVVRFHVERGSQVISAGTELIGDAQAGERLTFITDETLVASGAHIALALTYQDGFLQLLRAVDIPESMLAQRPSPDPVAANLGPNPALFLAIENLPANHLSRMSIFFDLAPEAHLIRRSLERETWCLVSSGGHLSAQGLLFPKPINGGVQQLDWLVRETQSGQDPKSSLDDEMASVPRGFYGPRLFLFPVVGEGRQFTCKIPRGMDSGLMRIFGKGAQGLFSNDRAWLRISMPQQIHSLQNSVGSIVLNAMTASNVECFNQTVRFSEHGTCIPIASDEGGAGGHLVSAISIVGESTGPYQHEMQSVTNEGRGRYGIRNGRIDLQPGISSDGRQDGYANLRVWVTKGRVGNTVGPGQVSSFGNRNPDTNLKLGNPTAAVGGTDGEDLAPARERFASSLLSRDRIVTRSDVINSARSFDSRIVTAEVAAGVVRTEHGLQRVEHVTIRVKKGDFVDPAEELRILREGLLRHLSSRFPHGTRLSVELVH
jgi:hypothetical protein